MFDYVGDRRTKEQGSRVASTTTSLAIHLFVVALLVGGPILFTSYELPDPPEDMLAFVVSSPPPPPPPPAPAPAPAAAEPEAASRESAEVAQPEVEPTPVGTSGDAAPVEAPSGVRPETGTLAALVGRGVEGGVAGGVPGGVVGGLPSAGMPPATEPVRIGGAIQAPALVHRVEPEYPAAAQAARVEGTVILEATVDTSGRVQSVQVLRSGGLLDEAAVAAVKQWRYSPLMLNQKPEPFVLTVTVAFDLDR